MSGRDPVVWLPRKMDCAAATLGKRTVYVKHWLDVFGRPIAAADTWFSIPAFVRVKGKRISGYVTPRDGMAFQQEHEPCHFCAHTGQGHDNDRA